MFFPYVTFIYFYQVKFPWATGHKNKQIGFIQKTLGIVNLYEVCNSINKKYETKSVPIQWTFYFYQSINTKHTR